MFPFEQCKKTLLQYLSKDNQRELCPTRAKSSGALYAGPGNPGPGSDVEEAFSAKDEASVPPTPLVCGPPEAEVRHQGQ